MGVKFDAILKKLREEDPGGASAHADLTGVTSGQHHAKYTDAEAVAAVDLSGKANVALDNLASVQISTDLIFADDAVSTEYIIGVDDQTTSNAPGNPLTIESGFGNGSGAGGDLSFFAGGGTATGDGGNFILSAGKGQGGGSHGQVKIQNPANARNAILDTSLLSAVDRTYTFPDNDGTFALISDIPAAGATIELDNLGVTAINADLLFDTNSAYDIGDAINFLANLYVDKIFISTSKSQTDVSISGFATTQTRHQGILVENQAGFAYLFLKGDVGGGADAGQIHFGSGNFPDAAKLSVFNDDLTIAVTDPQGKLILEEFGHQIEFTTTGQDKFNALVDSAIDLGSPTRFWNANFTDELILTNVGARSSSADKLVLSAIDLSAGNTILDMNTEGTGVVGSGTPTADRTVAIRVNGEVIYLIGSTVSS